MKLVKARQRAIRRNWQRLRAQSPRSRTQRQSWVHHWGGKPEHAKVHEHLSVTSHRAPSLVPCRHESYGRTNWVANFVISSCFSKPPLGRELLVAFKGRATTGQGRAESPSLSFSVHLFLNPHLLTFTPSYPYKHLLSATTPQRLQPPSTLIGTVLVHPQAPPFLQHP